jgi:hypothetical protein
MFTKVSIEIAVDTTHIGIQTLPDCSLLSLDLENAFSTISRLSFLAEINKYHARHPVIPLVEIIYSRDSIVYYCDPTESSAFHGTI